MKTRVAAVQMVSTASLPANLEAADRLVGAAAGEGARIVALPENFYLIGRHEADKVKLRERDGAGPIQDFLAAAARRHRVWLIGGTAPIETRDESRILSACLVFDDAGRRVARYDKMHLFRFDGGGAERYDEARTLEPGAAALAIASPFGRLALSICYDVRFPELYRSLGEFDVMFVPSAFTVPTGRAHWEVLLRARAVENQAYVIAPAQGGRARQRTAHLRPQHDRRSLGRSDRAAGRRRRPRAGRDRSGTYPRGPGGAARARQSENELNRRMN